MRSSMVRSLLQSVIQRYKSVPQCATVLRFSNDQQIGPIRMASSTSQADLVSSTIERRELMALWPGIVKDLTDNGPYADIPDAMEWLKKFLQYTVPNSQKLRPLTIMYAYRMLARPEQITDENLRRVRILGWCHEMNQAHYFFNDDIIDCSEMRRGQACWHLQENPGSVAVNDNTLLDQATYMLAKKYFRNEKYYVDILETFHTMTQRLALGQTLEILTAKRGTERNLDMFTPERYDTITNYKAALYVYYAPVKLAMYLLGIPETESHKPLMKLLWDMGKFYQVQDDYVDIYSDASAAEEIPTDIQEGKCTWPIVEALQRASPSQRRLLEECFGYEDPEKVARVKQLFDDLELPKIYAKLEEEHYKLIKTRIQQISCGVPHDLLLKFCFMNYRRNK